LIGVLALAAAGCGSHAHGPNRIVSLSLSAADDFPGPPSVRLTINEGARLASLARLVPLPLPRPTTTTAARTARAGLTVCFPMDLAIGLSNGTTVTYPSCDRPAGLRRVMRALCPLLHKPGFCFSYRHELNPG
jgi:hypothetical protein